jgi:hypothetical protein
MNLVIRLYKVMPEKEQDLTQIYSKFQDQDTDTRFSDLFSPYDEFLADTIAALYHGGPINGKDLGLSLKYGETDERDFLSEEVISASKLSRFHGVLIHMRSWLGHNRLDRSLSPEEKFRLFENLVKASAMEIEAIYTGTHPTIQFPEMSEGPKRSSSLIERLNKGFLSRFLNIESN